MDRARLLVATAMVAGPEAAVSSAAHALGDQGLAEVLPYLQPAALDRYARTALKDQEWSLKDLSAAAVAAAGVEPPQLQQLRRVTAKSVVTVLLIAAVAYTLISLFSDVDLSEVVSEISTADWAYVAVGLVISAAIPTVQAVGTVASSIEPVRYGPVMALQYAIQFLALVLPASAARLALEVRFFQRFGMPAASALSIGMIDSFMGFLVQMALLGLIALGGLPGVTPRTPSAESATSGSSGGSSALWLAIALVVIGAAMVVLLPRLRRRVNRAVARWRGALVEQAHAARHSAGVLRRPGHVVTILGANLVIQVAYAVVLGICLAAFGGQADLAQLIFVNTAVSLFAGFMPVPGGMGVAEAGYTAGLQAIGVPSAVAISTALTFRLVTFYLPPIWGSFGMRWLKRNDFV